jgi:hypothetical protein
MQVKVDLTSPGEVFTEIFWVKITDPLPTHEEKVPEPEEGRMGLPKPIRVYESAPGDTGLMTWEQLALSSIEMSWDTVIHPQLEGEVLEAIYINMDSHVLKEYKSRVRNPTSEQIQLAEARYLSAVYFHTLFLYVINRNRGYQVVKEDNGTEKEVDIADYLKDIFSSHYAAFLMNFGMGELMEGLG